MDGRRFDDLARSWASGVTSRRRVLTGAVAAVVGALLGGRPSGAQTGCPVDQVRRGAICVCRATGHPPGPEGCPCPNGRRRCTPTGPCVQCCGNGDCPGTPCLNGICGCPSGQKLCRGQCIPNSACCENVDCEDGDPCTIDTCQSNRTCLHTPVANGQPGACGAGRVCCGGGCVTVASFCPPEQNFVACQCLCDGNETKCGVECCVNGAESCLGGTAAGACCENASVCVGGTVCCAGSQDCCGDVCRDLATFCPVEQTYSNCDCICDGNETKCGVECCVNASETCLGGTVAGACCPTAKVCGAACCTSTEECCSGVCETVATFCPPEQTFDDCACVCDGNETKCGPECCLDATETCIDAATDFCCPTPRACLGDTFCCDPDEACCVVAASETCVEIATFCPPAQTFDDCVCTCPGATVCGSLCCNSTTETCLDNTSCCATARACVVTSAPDECCTGSQVCGGGTEGCCLPTDAGTCAADGDCCAPLWCEDSTDLCRVPQANGGTCDRAAQCDSGFCCPTENVCGVDGGDTCLLDTDCCGNLWCRAADDICVPALDVGLACDRAAQCEVGNCCATDDVCGVADGDPCVPANDECCPGLACRGDAGSETCQPNLPPVADSQTGADAIKTGDVTPVTITLTGSDPNNGDSLTFEIVDPATTGTLGAITQLTPTSASVIYTPVQGSFGTGSETYSFTFKVNDGAVDSLENATVEIEVFDEPEDASYTTVGNTELVTDGFNTAVSTPKVTDPDGVLVTTATLTIADLGPIATTQGGTVVLDSDGHFRYTPPTSSSVTSDTFDYEVNWGGTATVTVTLTERVWYVKNDAPTGGLGRSNDPFDTLVEAQNASVAGDHIFVYRGDGTSTGQNAGITLKNTQQLIGEGVALVVASFNLVVAGLRPQLTNTVGAAITLASDNTVRGLDVVGPGGAGIVGTGLGSATFTANNIDVTRTGGPALDLENGAVNAAFGTLSTTNSTARGLRLVGLTGTLSATSGSISGADLGAVFVSGGTAAITYPGTITNDAGPAVEVNSRTGGSVTLSGAITDTGQGVRASNNTGGMLTLSNASKSLQTGANSAVVLTNNGGATIQFTGGGLDVDSSVAAFVASGGGSVTVSGSGNSIVSTGGPAVNVNGLTTAITLADASSSGSSTTGIDLTNLANSSSFTVIGTTAVNNALGTSINLNTIGATSSITFGTTNITNRRGAGIAASTVSGTLGFGTVTIPNPNTVAGNAISISSSAATTTISSVDIDNPVGAGIALTGNTGAVTVSGGDITGAGGPAVDVDGQSAGVTYNGTITNSAGLAVEVTNRTGGTVSFGGAITDAGATNAGISLGSNAGTITFTAAVSLTDTSAAALAISGGTAAISFSNLTISQTNGQGALAATNVAGGSLTVQGAGGINVSFTGTDTANDAIVLDGTGAAYDVSLASVTINTNDMRHGLVLGDLGSGSDVTITTGTITSEGNGKRVAHFPTATNGIFNLSGVTLNGNTSDGIALGATQLGTYQFGNFDVNTPNPAAPTNGIGVSVTGTTASVTFASIDQTGGATAIQVTNLGTGGSVTVNGGAIANTTVAGVDVNGGVGAISIASTITNTAGRTAQVQNRTGGAVTLSGNLTGGGTGILVKDNTTASSTISFSGTTKTISTTTNAAVTLDNNDGATINFSNGGLAITTTSGIGFDAKNGATAINVTDTFNTITTTTGVALSVVSSTIGSSGLTFRSISAGTGASGPTTGIVLTSTGMGGGLTVTGDGGGSNNGSGGTIQNTTGAAAILLSSVTGVNLAHMNVQNNPADGINGSNVTGFNLNRCNVTNNGNVVQERGVEIANLLGTASVTNSTISNNAEDNLYIVNTSDTLTLLTVTNSTFSNTSAAIGNDGLHFRGEGTANMAISVTGCTFANNRGDHFQVVTDAASAAIIDAVFTGNTLTGAAGNLGASVTINTGGSSQTTFNVSNNNIVGAVSSAITINQSNTATLEGTVAGNTIGNPAVVDSGSFQGDGINVTGNNAGTIHVAVTGNLIRQYSNLAGIGVAQRDGDGSVHATITGNTISNPGTFASHGILAQAGAAAGDGGFLCIDIGGAGALANSIAGSGANDGTDFRLRQRIETTVRLPGYGGAATDTAAVVAFVQGRNTGSETGSATVNSPPGGGFVGGAACMQP